jgi:hypothetical protein
LSYEINKRSRLVISNSLVFCSEAAPEDFDYVCVCKFFAATRARSLSTAKRLLDALFACHMTTLGHDVVFSLLANWTYHLCLPVLVLELNVLHVKITRYGGPPFLIGLIFYYFYLVFIGLAV